MSLSTSSLKAQQSVFTDGLSIKIGAGVTTFYGDMSPTGISILKNTEAGFAGAAIKMLNPFLGVQLQFFTGYLGSLRPDLSQYFDGNVNEFSVSVRLEPIPLFNSSYSGKLNPYLRGGLATTGFRAVRRDYSTNTVFLPTYGYDTDGITKIPSENALSIPIALGLRYKLNDKIAIEAEYSLSITNTDVMDAVVGTAANNDYFGFTQLGIRYTLKPKQTAISSKPEQSQRLSRRERKMLKNQDNVINKQPEEEIIEIITPTHVVKSIPTSNIFVEAIMPENPKSGNVFEVRLRINKGDYQGPAILSQSFPDGFTALESDIGYGTFSFVNQKVNIAWRNLPADSIITYSYYVRPSELVFGSHTINGSFEFKEEDGPKMIQFANYIVVQNKIESDIDAKILRLLGDKTQFDEYSEETKEQDNKGIKIGDILQKYGTDPSTKIRSTASNVKFKKNVVLKGVKFRIQCGAFRSSTEGKKILSKYWLNETAQEDYHNGWYKYTVGSFETYEEAEVYRDRFRQRSKIYTAFIVAFENGKRLDNLQQAFK